MTPQLVVAGNLIVDDVVHEDGTAILGQAGGAALYAALGAALWDIRVGVASVVGEDFPEATLDALAAKGVDLGGVRRIQGPGLRIWLLYEGRRRQVVHHLASPSHAIMSPVLADIPEDWKSVATHLAPMPLALQLAWIKALRELESAEPLLSLDPFELIHEDSLEAIRSVFQQADVVFLSEDELLLDSALESPHACLERLAQPAPGTASRLRHLVLKRGARGGVAHDREAGSFLTWSPRTAGAVDATGAGDAFAGGVLAGMILKRPLAESLQRGVVSASFALETSGADGLLRATPQECAERAVHWFGGLT